MLSNSNSISHTYRTTKVSLEDTVQLSALLWPNFNKKEVVQIEIPTVEVGMPQLLQHNKLLM